MIHSVLIFNKNGQPRLVKFYTPVDVVKQQLLLKQVYDLISKRIVDEQSSFLVTPPDLLGAGSGGNTRNEYQASFEDDDYEDEEQDTIQIIYKNFATLYFVFIVDEQESELSILDLIQTFVECLDMCFRDVCELDLVFGWHTLQSVLEEMVQGGIVIETDKYEIVKAIDLLNSSSTSKSVGGLASFFDPSQYGNSSSTGNMLSGSNLSNAFSMFASGGFSNWAGHQ